MKYADFLKIIMTNKKFEEELSELHNMGFDFFEGKYKLSNLFYGVVNTSLSTHYDDDGIEWIYWFMYENDYGQKDWSKTKPFSDDEKRVPHGAVDENGEPICYSYESLWNYLEKNHKIKEDEKN
jgi:hypothetical protein